MSNVDVYQVDENYNNLEQFTLEGNIWSPLGWGECEIGCKKREAGIFIFGCEMESKTLLHTKYTARPSYLGSTGPSMQFSNLIWATEHCL